MFMKRVYKKLEEIEQQVILLNKELIVKNRLLTAQESLITDLMKHLNDTMDRLMSRNFQELAMYSLPTYPNVATSMDLSTDEDLAGTVSALDLTTHSGNDQEV